MCLKKISSIGKSTANYNVLDQDFQFNLYYKQMFKNRVIAFTNDLGTFGRYFSVGSFAFIVDASMFMIFRNVFGISLALSNVMSMLTGLVISFSLNHLWVFNKTFSPAKSTVRFMVFFSNNLLVLGVSTGLIVALEELSSSLGYDKLRELLCKVLVMGVVVVWNFTIYSKIIFKKHQ